jgi:transcriptional regulator with XRE-family HTH domain
MAAKHKLNLVGPTIRELRIKRGWTQNHLARKLCSLGRKVSRSAVGRMERTEMGISDCDLVFLAEALKTDVPDLFPADATAETIPEKIQSHRLISNSSKPFSATFRRFRFWNSRNF